MYFNQKFNEWTKAHVFYKLYFHSQGNNTSLVEKREYEWRARNYKEAPQGHLLIKNSIFDSFENNQSINLLHITTDLDNILKEGIIYSSGGCLVGSIYCTPLFSEQSGDKFRLHNLGSYVFNEETPMILQKSDYLNSKKIIPLIITLKYPQRVCNSLIGIDYLRLGDIHYSLYRELSYLLSNSERQQLESTILDRIKNTVQFLNLVKNAFYFDRPVDTDSFFQEFIRAVNYLPILGYFYFEALSEYLFLYMHDKETQKFAQLGEFYNLPIKQMMFNLCPKLLENFTLGEFKPSLKELTDYFNEKKLVSSKENFKHFIDYLIERLIFLINARLFLPEISKVDFRTVQWDFDGIASFAVPLIGHLIHRELRNFGRYPDFYFYFDQYKALQVWNFWNHHNVAVSFNGIIPKGEVGINPAYPDMTYEIFEGEVSSKKNFFSIRPLRKLNIKIVPRLISPRHSFMRNKYYAGI